MYRILAIFWLVMGVGLIIYDTYNGNPAMSIPYVGWSAGWVCLLLAVYNLLRWWSKRMNRINQQTEAQARLQRRHYQREPPPVRREPPDPNFNFSDEPPPSGEGEQKR